ncbi:MAG: hypothetical protein KC414_10840, partial [Romboutsia sp.]|nr:hypothetical protein [Romboutsia sp.]
QPLDSLVLTPSGFKRMGDLEVGELVSCPDGSFTEILGIFPQGLQKVYKVYFDDGTTVECTLDHLWEIESRKKVKYIKTTKEIIDSGLITKNKTRKWSIPKPKYVNFISDKLLPLDPYLLGCLLGDGNLRDSIGFSCKDSSVLNQVLAVLEENDYGVKLTDVGNNCDYRFKKIDCSTKDKNYITKTIIELGLYNNKSEDKFIPKDYLKSSIDCRIELLRGLLDTDGTISKSGTITYTTVSKQLSKDIEFLGRSLGMRVTTSSRITQYVDKYGKQKDGMLSYRSTLMLGDLIFDCFKSNKKTLRENHYKQKDFSNKYIVDIEYTGIKKECQCIKVAHPDELYITNDFNVTHNTTLTLHAIAEAQKEGGLAGFIDAEHALDTSYAQKLNVNVDDLIMSQPDFGEQALEILDKMVSSNLFSIIVVDSVAALTPKAEIEGEMGDSKMGLQARLMSQ